MGSGVADQSVEIKAHIEIDGIGRFEILRFGVDRFGADPAFPDDSHDLSEAGLGVLAYRIQQAKRMVFSAQVTESALRLRSTPPSRLLERAFFGLITMDDGKPGHFLASIVFENVLIESHYIARPVPYIPAVAVVAILADTALISYSKNIGVPHAM
jgi:hypothetical protein